MNNEFVKEVESDIDKYKSISSLKNLDGGKLLVRSLESDVASSVNILLGSYKSANHVELLSIIAKLDSNLSLLRVLVNSDKNLELATEELTRILAE